MNDARDLPGAWGAWLRHGHIRSWPQDQAEVTYRAFVEAWNAATSLAGDKVAEAARLYEQAEDRLARRPVHWPSLLRELDASERAWNNRTVRYPREDAVPWLPFPRGQFVALLADAVEAAPARTGGSPAAFLAPRFLDVGAGNGTKIRLASALFGLECQGIEIVPELAAEAQAHGANVELADAFEWEGYDHADIVYVNRPSTLMAELEARVMDGMTSGAVLMMVNGRCDPGAGGWTLVSREWGEPVHGCWIKP